MITLKIPHRELALLTAILLYGIFSQPTPDAPGAAEFIIGLCLLVAVGAPRLLQLVSGAALWAEPKPRIIPASYLLIIPLVIGVAQGLPPAAIMRDVIPLLYLLLPVILILPAANTTHITWAVCAAGTAFAVRYILITGADLQHWARLQQGDNLLYLPLEPAVLFAGLYLAFWGLTRITRPAFKSAAVLPCLSLLASAACFAVIGGLLMRAALVLAIIALIIFTLLQTRRTLAPFVIMALLTVLLWPSLQEVFDLLWRKTQAVGFNARAPEFAAVWHAISGNPLTLLCGQGWGTTLADPAVGGLRVGYTHSMLSYFLIKTGLIGTTLLFIYLGSLWPHLKHGWQQHRHLCLAAGPPLLLAFTLYTSYKYFTCGLLLWLITNQPKHHAHPHP